MSNNPGRIASRYCVLILLAALVMPHLGQAAENTHTNSIGMEFVLIPAGTFQMGSDPNDREAAPSERPRHRVTISKPFYLGKYEVTLAQWEAVMGSSPYTLPRSNPYYGLPGMADRLRKPTNPATVSWNDAQAFIKRLNEREGHNRYRLPTEAEWEYACRAGTTTRYNFGDDADAALIRDHAWFSRNAESATHPVGTRKPNAWGLFDVHGNVLEWCLDGWRSRLPGGQVTNVAVAPTGTLRAVRGGSWLYEARHARSANRDSYGVLVRCSDLGFRVVLARDVEPPR